MDLSIEATYEGGVLKPVEPLPLAEHERVHVVIRQDAAGRVARVQSAYGLMGGKLDADTLRQLALDPQVGVEESP